MATRDSRDSTSSATSGRRAELEVPPTACALNEAGAERVQLVVQVLARDDAPGDQPAAMADRVKQRVEGSALHRAATALAGQGDKRGAAAVVVLEAS